jgi:hypothetical protein
MGRTPAFFRIMVTSSVWWASKIIIITLCHVGIRDTKVLTEYLPKQLKTLVLCDVHNVTHSSNGQFDILLSDFIRSLPNSITKLKIVDMKMLSPKAETKFDEASSVLHNLEKLSLEDYSMTLALLLLLPPTLQSLRCFAVHAFLISLVPRQLQKLSIRSITGGTGVPISQLPPGLKCLNIYGMVMSNRDLDSRIWAILPRELTHLLFPCDDIGEKDLNNLPYNLRTLRVTQLGKFRRHPLKSERWKLLPRNLEVCDFDLVLDKHANMNDLPSSLKSMRLVSYESDNDTPYFNRIDNVNQYASLRCAPDATEMWACQIPQNLQKLTLLFRRALSIQELKALPVHLKNLEMTITSNLKQLIEEFGRYLPSGLKTLKLRPPTSDSIWGFREPTFNGPMNLPIECMSFFPHTIKKLVFKSINIDMTTLPTQLECLKMKLNNFQKFGDDDAGLLPRTLQRLHWHGQVNLTASGVDQLPSTMEILSVYQLNNRKTNTSSNSDLFDRCLSQRRIAYQVTN